MNSALASALGALPVFKGFTAGHLDELARHATEVSFDAGELIIRDGDKAHDWYVIRRGTVALELHTAGCPPLVIHKLTDGEVLGCSWLFPPYEWRFAGRAITPTAAVALNAEQIRNCCEENHDLGYMLMRRLAWIIIERLHSTRLQLQDARRICPVLTRTATAPIRDHPEEIAR